jgi:hypothetical protein
MSCEMRAEDCCVKFPRLAVDMKMQRVRLFLNHTPAQSPGTSFCTAIAQVVVEVLSAIVRLCGWIAVSRYSPWSPVCKLE